MSHVPLPDGIAPVANHSLPMLLLRLRETVLLPLRPILRQFDLTEQQARILIVLSEAGTLEMLALAEACCLSSPSLSRIIPKLHARGWIEHRRPNDDQGQMSVRLRPAGHELTKRLRDALRHTHGETKQQVGEAHVAILTRGLETALDALGTPTVMHMAGMEDGDAT